MDPSWPRSEVRADPRDYAAPLFIFGSAGIVLAEAALVPTDARAPILSSLAGINRLAAPTLAQRAKSGNK